MTGVDSPDRALTPARLATLLALGLLVIVTLLTWLAPAEGILDLERLTRLVDAGRVVRLEVGERGLTAYLTEPVALDDGGGRRRVEAVIVPGAPTADAQAAVARWQAAGLRVGAAVVEADAGPAQAAWAAGLCLLLLAGLGYLVAEARRFRREGSPRQHLEQARKDLEAGRITPEEFERRATNLTMEM